jgi:hypothetical protein
MSPSPEFTFARSHESVRLLQPRPTANFVTVVTAEACATKLKCFDRDRLHYLYITLPPHCERTGHSLPTVVTVAAAL